MTNALHAATDHYLMAHPEEATTLGLRSYDDRWADRSWDALSRLAREHRRHLAALAAEGSHDLDRAMLAAHLNAEARRIERGDVLASLEASMLPHAILSFQSMQAHDEASWQRLAERAASLPATLAQQEALLTRGLAEGRPADAVVARALLEHELPGVANGLERLGTWPASLGRSEPRCASALREAGARAADAYRSHARFLAEHVAAAGASSYALGRDEYTERLKSELAIDESPEALAARFEARLPALEQALIEAARRVDPGVTDAAGARALVTALFAQTLEEGDDPLAVYRENVARAAEFAVERGLFHLPAGYDLAIRPMPPHRLGQVSSTNWPAPPLDPTQHGHLLVSPRASDHCRATLEPLAVHEATPGHYLQSVAFQARFASAAHVPARLLGMTDDVAMATGFFGPMLSIEGFATRAEEVMDEAGFFSPQARLLETASRIIRAVRVVADVRLHTGEASRAEIATMMAERTGFPLRWGQGQAVRYSRIPLQAITYAVGAEQIAKLASRRLEKLQQRSEHDLATFHDELLAEGPVPPGWLDRA